LGKRGASDVPGELEQTHALLSRDAGPSTGVLLEVYALLRVGKVGLRRCVEEATPTEQVDDLDEPAVDGVPGVISGKFSVRETATKSLLGARHDYI